MSSVETKWRWLLVTAVAPISWGATYYVTRHFLPADAPLWGAALRALPAGLILLLLARRLPRGAWWGKAVILGILNFGAFFVLVYLAAQLLPTSMAASVMALAPVVLGIIAWPLLGQRPTAAAGVAVLVGVVGAVLLIGAATGGIDPLGAAVSLTALVLSSLGAVLTTRWRDDLPLVATTSWQLIAGGAILLAIAVVVEGPPPAVSASSATAYAAIAIVATALAFLCWFAGLRHLSASTVGTVGLLNPATGVILGVALVGESLTPLQIVGLVLIGAAILLTQRRARRPGRHAAAGTPALAVPTGAVQE